MEFKTIKDIALVVLLVIIGVLIGQGNRMSSNFKQEEREYKAEKIKLSKIILNERQNRIEEAAKRKEERKIDSAATANIKYYKKQDSLTQVREIKFLIKEFRKLTERQLDSTLTAEYEKAIYN